MWFRCWDAFSDLAGTALPQLHLFGFLKGIYSRMAQAQKAPRTHGSRYCTELFGGFAVSHDAYAFSSWSHFRKQGVGWFHQAVLRRDKRRDRQADSAGHVKAARRPWKNLLTGPYMWVNILLKDMGPKWVAWILFWVGPLVPHVWAMPVLTDLSLGDVGNICRHITDSALLVLLHGGAWLLVPRCH